MDQIRFPFFEAIKGETICMKIYIYIMPFVTIN